MTSRGAASLAVQAFAWGGGALFVAALASYVWFFAVTIAAPGPPGVRLAPAAAWNVALVVVFALHHSAMARSGAKAWLTRTLPPELERSTYVWVASALLIGVCVLWQPVPGLLYRVDPPASWLLWGTQGIGVLFTIGGARVLDALDLAGIRQVLGPRRASDTTIRVVWPFTVVRHPIYLGWALIVWGTPTMTLDRFVWALVTTAYLVIAIPWEERSLSAAAGPAYQAYRQRVRWRMVPGLY
jgi:protein-S-isoprenylcysteine O-methyltransferase Ste14